MSGSSETPEMATSIVDFLRERGCEPVSIRGEELTYHCPFPDHDDEHSSFSVNTEKNVYQCFGCGRTGNGVGLLRELEEADRGGCGDRPPVKQKQVARREDDLAEYTDPPRQNVAGCTLEQVARDKGLPVEFLADCGWSTIPYYLSGPAVRISYKDENHEERAVRFRTPLRGPDRFRWKKGSKPMPYGLWRLPQARAEGFILLVEGETDVVTLWHAGFPAIGVPGASTWSDGWARRLEEVAKIFVVMEPDEGGQRLLDRLSSSPLRDRLHIVNMGADPELVKE